MIKNTLIIGQCNSAREARQDVFNVASGPLDQTLTSSAPEAACTVNLLCSAIEGLGKRSARSDGHAALRRFMTCLVVNMFASWVFAPNRYTAIKLGRSDYTATDFKYLAVIKAVHGLEALGYLTRIEHYWDAKRNRGLVTRFLPTANLTALFKNWDLSVIKVTERSPLIEIRPNGKTRRSASRKGLPRLALLPWPKSHRGAKARMVKNLRVLNEALRKQFQAMAIPDHEIAKALGGGHRPVHIYRQMLHRSFTDDPHNGGRFYGPWWQSINRNLRQHIKMATPGSSVPLDTVEIDFDALHPAMLYATRKFPVKGDLYAIYPDAPFINKQLRPVIKQLFLSLINADTDGEAKNSFKEYVNTELYPEWALTNWDERIKPLPPFGTVDKLLAEMYPGCPTLDQLVSDIKLHNYRIAEYLGTGASRWLMFEDSQIAESIMLTMYREHGIVPLPVHDSFIVPAHLESALKKTMENAFASRFAGITPQTTRKVRTEVPMRVSDEDLYSKLLKQWKATGGHAARKVG